MGLFSDGGGFLGGTLGQVPGVGGALFGNSIMGGLGGKETGDQFAPYREVPLPADLQALQQQARQVQSSGLEQFLAQEKMNNLSPATEARIQGDLEKIKLAQQSDALTGNLRSQRQGLISGTADAKRLLRERIAQRGLGSSSIGLAQEATLAKRQGEAIGQSLQQEKEINRQRQLAASAIDTNSAIRERNAFANRALGNAQIGASVLGTPGTLPQYAIGSPSEKTGGLAGLMPLIGAGVGAFYGGPAGAAAGMQVGSGVGQAAKAY